MRLAILISLAACGWGSVTTNPFIRCEVAGRSAFILPEKLATAHRVDLISSLPDSPEISGFWTPPEAEAVVADRLLRQKLQDAFKDPKLLFPDLTEAEPTHPESLEYQRREMAAILEHYGDYQRQYVGAIIEGRHYILCNYVVGPDLDASAKYLYIQKYFAPDDRTHYLQGRYDYDWREFSHVSFVGSWQAKGK